MKAWKLILSTLFISCIMPAFAQTNIIAAENMYGDIAKTIGGKDVNVTNIMTNPNQDPHLFSADPKTVKLLADLTPSDIVIINGADYDPWAVKLLSNTKAQIINVATINNVATGANPHLWYNLNYVDTFANTLAQMLNKAQPAEQKTFDKNLKHFLEQTKKINKKIDEVKDQYPNLPVTATEPVAGYLTDALGLNMLNQHFQLSVMNDTEPSAQDRAKMISDLTNHNVVLLIYNEQVTDPTTDSIRKIAQQAGVPIVGVSELMPAAKSTKADKDNEMDAYLTWYDATLAKIQAALAKSQKH